MADKRFGRQSPTTSVICPYEQTHGQEAIDIYNKTGKTALEWQVIQSFDILAYQIDDDGNELWTHTKYGYSVPRRNGKSEIALVRELFGIHNGQKGLHTAHQTQTSSEASKKLAECLRLLGMKEVLRPRPDEEYPNSFSYSKQYGLEKITFLFGDHGEVSFRTRTGSAGLGIGYDYIIVDEAQEYTEEQETALLYVVSDSKNPQTIYCGTPPTMVSKGTVFQKFREKVLTGRSENAGWAEWSVDSLTDPHNVEAWYECNPSLGVILTERKIKDEITGNEQDFNIQRLGLWLTYNQASVISGSQWSECCVDKLPKLTGQMQVGIKFGKDGQNVSMGIAIKTSDERIYTEVIDCRPVSAGYGWIISFLLAAQWQTVAIDGANGPTLAAEMKDAGIKQKPILLRVSEIIDCHTTFMQAIGDGGDGTFLHSRQPSLDQVATNCDRRLIGSNGGTGFKAIEQGAEIALLECLIIAFWVAKTAKPKRKHTIVY